MKLHSLLFTILLSLTASIFSNSLDYGDNQIQVLSAVVKDKPIVGAQVIFQRTGETSVIRTTDSRGLVTVPTSFTDDSNSLVIIKKTGYSTLVAKCSCRGLTYAISPNMQDVDSVRAVLSWGATPSDLDLHVRYQSKHVYFEHMEETDVNLDVDDTTSYGPETITITKKRYGVSYSFFVHDYTNKSVPSLKELSYSGAKVYVYIGSSLIKTFTVPRGIVGNVWDVFTLSETGEIIPSNQFYKSNETESNDILLSNYEASGSGSTSLSVDVDESKRVNRLGEQAYHNGNLERSVELYKTAIELNPNYGQAYSNLGLSYYKNGNRAEAIWANRKAIALASGSRSNITKANSYYNIARIYEDESNYDEAIRYYSFAYDNNPREAYTRGINRVRSKM